MIAFIYHLSDKCGRLFMEFRVCIMCIDKQVSINGKHNQIVRSLYN